MAVAAYVTTQTRLKLYEYLSKLGDSVMYCDTDSVMYIQNEDEPPKVKTAYYLGDLTDELEEFVSGSYIEVFVSGGLEIMHFLYLAPLLESVQPDAT